MMPGREIALFDANIAGFDGYPQSKQVTGPVDFWAAWCGPAKRWDGA